MNLPPYNIYPNLSNDKITLRQVLTADIPELIAISFYNSIQASTLEEAEEMQEKIDSDYESGNSIHWGIIDKTTNKIVGTCGYYRGLDNGIGELGCILLPQYRAQGLMTAAMQLAINFGQDTIKLNSIKAITSIQNYRAIKLLERLHFIKIADLQNEEVEYKLS